IGAFDFDLQASAGLGDAEPFGFEILDGAGEFVAGAIAGGLEMAILHPEQHLSAGDALAGLDVDAFDAAFEADTDSGDGALDGGFAENDVVVAVTAPGNRDADGGGGGDENDEDDHETDDKGADLAGRRRLGVIGGLRVWFVHEAGARRACDYSRHPCSLTLRPSTLSASAT